MWKSNKKHAEVKAEVKFIEAAAKGKILCVGCSMKLHVIFQHYTMALNSRNQARNVSEVAA